jgi:Na+/proline symporter
LVQFLIFISGAIFALFWITDAVPGGVPEILAIADQKAKLALYDLSIDPRKTYTLWVGLIGCTCFQLGQDAIDQVTTQRLLCCENHREAQKAVIFAGLGAFTTFIMLAVGLGLVAYYTVSPLPESVRQLFLNEPDRVFPYFIMHELPPGISGIIIAALFAAGISTLDSALAALSQTFVSGVYQRFMVRKASERHYLVVSRFSIVAWGLILALLAGFFHLFSKEGLLKLGLLVPGYVYGALLGISILALLRRGSFRAILAGTVLSVSAVLYLQYLDVTFFWWYPAAAAVMIGVVFAIDSLFGK